MQRPRPRCKVRGQRCALVYFDTLDPVRPQASRAAARWQPWCSTR